MAELQCCKFLEIFSLFTKLLREYSCTDSDWFMNYVHKTGVVYKEGLWLCFFISSGNRSEFHKLFQLVSIPDVHTESCSCSAIFTPIQILQYKFQQNLKSKPCTCCSLIATFYSSFITFFIFYSFSSLIPFWQLHIIDYSLLLPLLSSFIYKVLSNISKEIQFHQKVNYLKIQWM